jgi:hypothetical protein
MLSGTRSCYPKIGMDLTAHQAGVLEILQQKGFQLGAFPLYANYIVARKGNCAALLAPVLANGFTVYGSPTWMLGENLGVRVKRNDGEWFVFKKEQVPATPERIEELEDFSADLADALIPTA